MSINAISAAMSASVYVQAAGNKIPSWFLDKLVDLGINTEEVTSASQAKALISKAEESKEETDDSSEQTDKNGESVELRRKAEDLADDLGVKVKESDTIDDIIDNIQDVIDKTMKIAIKDNDEALFNAMKAYQGDLDDIIAENNGGGISNNIVYSFMDMVAEQNKYALKLNEK